MKRVFNADDIEEKFVKYGYTIIRNLINEDEVEELRQVYEQNRMDNANKSFYVSHWIEGGDTKANIDLGVQKVLVPAAQKYLNDYVPVFAAMSVKHPKPDSAMHLHQDWAHVDETKFRSINMWVALDETNDKNGAICLLKGSHRLFDYTRGVSIPDTFRHIPTEKLHKYLTDIYLGPGDAVAWDHRVVHGSNTNFTNKMRLAAVVNMRPADAQFLLYYIKPQTEIKDVEVYAPDHDFFIAYDSVNHPTVVEQVPFVKKYPYQDLNVQEADLVKFLTTEFPGEFPQLEKPKSFFSKLFSES